MGFEVLESALATTVADKTARFWSSSRRGRPTGPAPRLGNHPFEGIIDFGSRRALARTMNRSGGIGRWLPKRWTPDVTVYFLFDGPMMSASLLGRWQAPHPTRPKDLPRQPAGLTFLDLMRHEALVDAVEKDPQDLRGEPTTHYALRLDVDRLTWPKPDRSALAAGENSRLGRLAIKTLPDPRPKGILPAEVWLDQHGRLVRFSYQPTAADHPKHDRVPWFTTDLWDFGIPPQLEDWEHQPVIDPFTLEFPESEREMMRQAEQAHKH
jgi:hypothetical protein